MIRAALADVDAAADPVQAAELHERLGRYLSQTGEPEALEAYQTAVSLVPSEPLTVHRAKVLAAPAPRAAPRPTSWSVRAAARTCPT